MYKLYGVIINFSEIEGCYTTHKKAYRRQEILALCGVSSTILKYYLPCEENVYAYGLYLSHKPREGFRILALDSKNKEFEKNWAEKIKAEIRQDAILDMSTAQEELFHKTTSLRVQVYERCQDLRKKMLSG